MTEYEYRVVCDQHEKGGPCTMATGSGPYDLETAQKLAAVDAEQFHIERRAIGPWESVE